MGDSFKNVWSNFRHNIVAQTIRDSLPDWLINFFWHLPLALIASVLYKFPSRKLTLIGVTGTDGKTTTVYLINHILKTAGKKTAMISSVKAEIVGKESDTGFHVTSPHPFHIQRYLAQALKKKAEYAILEVTSHAIAQHRFWGCHFKIGVMTNIRPDHLDYHKSFDNYLIAKKELLLNAETAIVNKDDLNFKRIITEITKTSNCPEIITYSTQLSADITPKTIKISKQPAILPGEYNLANILAASAAALNLRIDQKKIHQSLRTFSGVPGRFQEIKTGSDFRVIIDFAHTPYALYELLVMLRQQRVGKGRIIAVFGCAGERGEDRRKMGKVAGELADLAIITAEDPRFEGVGKISEEIAQWAKKGGAAELQINNYQSSSTNTDNHHYFIRIPDRQESINFAVKIAGKEDILVLCGKGHEQSMNFEGVEYPWDEEKAVNKALKKRYGTNKN